MRRKSEHRGLFSGLTFSSAMILFGVMLAAGAIVGLVVSGVGSQKQQIAQNKASSPPPIRAVHIKPDLTQVKREKPSVAADKQILMSPAMLRQMSQLETRLGTLEKQIRSLSRSNLDLAEKVDTSGLDNRLEALEDSLQNFTASIDKRIKENERRAQVMNEQLPTMKETELTPSERNLLPPPFKTDTPKEITKASEPVEPKSADLNQQKKEPQVENQPDRMANKAQETASKPAPAIPEKPIIVEKTPQQEQQQKALMEKAAELAKPKAVIKGETQDKTAQKPAEDLRLADLSKPALQIEETEKAIEKTDGKTGWEPVVTYHNEPKRRVAALQKKPRFTTRRSSPEVTGSVQKKVPAPQKKPARKIVQKPYAVHIASASTLYRIKDSWLTLQRDNGILRGLRPHIVSAGEDKKAGAVPWKLLAGPVASEDEAARICTRLNAKGSYCRSTRLSGHPLKF